MSDYNEQGSALWMDERCGKFTSSDIHKLMIGGTRPMTEQELEDRPKNEKGKLISTRTTVDIEFGDTALTYIKHKIGEIKSGEVPIIENYALAWGREQEPYAAVQHARSLNVDLIECGFIQHKNLSYYGGSPDRKFILKGVNACAEYKCPVVYENHYSHCDIDSVEKLKKEYPEIYWQIQSNILLTDSSFCDFISFQPKLKSLFVFRVPRIDEDIKLMLSRIVSARSKLLELAEKYGVVIPEEKKTIPSLSPVSL